MKLKILALATLTILFTGCNKEPKQPDHPEQTAQPQKVEETAQQARQAEQPQPEIDYKAQFEQSDEKITRFMDRLDDSKTSREERVKILCQEWPNVYKTEYMPALMHLQPKAYTQEKMLADLKNATDFYKKGAGIECK